MAGVLTLQMLLVAAFLLNASCRQNFENKIAKQQSTRMKRRKKLSTAEIVFAVDNEGTLFLNGKEIAHVEHWRDSKSVEVEIGRGDTISIKAKDTNGLWYGVIADIYYRGRHFSTGHRGWKAVKKFALKDRTDQNAWMLPDYNSCQWKRGLVLPRANKMFSGKSRSFPYHKNNAKYVWAHNAGENDEIFMRFTIGGEICSSRRNAAKKRKTKKLVKSEINKKKHDKDNVEQLRKKLEAKRKVKEAKRKAKEAKRKAKEAKQKAQAARSGEKAGNGLQFCPCRRSSLPESKCWEMLPEGQMQCRERDCDRKFECVPEEQSDGKMVCVRRVTWERLVPDEGLGIGFCKMVYVAEREFYVPYHVPEEGVEE